MNQNKPQMRSRNARRVIARSMLMLGGGLLTILSLATPVLGQAAGAATQPAAHNAPSGRSFLITDGLGRDGKVALMSNKTTVVTTARPYKSVSIGQPEVADVTPVSPTNILVTAKRPGATQLVVWDDQNR